jgi:hypothetical protein
LPLARSRLEIAPAVVAPGFAVVRAILDAGNAGDPEAAVRDLRPFSQDDRQDILGA